MKKLFKVLIFTIFFALFSYFLYILFNKEVVITGFAFKNDRIFIEVSKTRINNISISNYENEKNLGSIYEKINFLKFFNNSKVYVRIDSANNRLLDTSFVIPDSYKKPIISFQDPNETNFKRTVFVIDESDKRIIIP